MSRGPSPSPQGITQLPSRAPPPLASLRVLTDSHATRARSNTTLAQQSPLYPPSGSSSSLTSHQSSRSYSHSYRDLSSVSDEKRQVPVTRLILEAAVESPDKGDTLDLSRKGIETIADEDVEMLRRGVGTNQRGVWRLALSYNSLREASFAPNFNKLTRLRYLNLKGNHMSTVPLVLTEMPSLEILDLSKNRLERLPESPGRMVNLKVLSLTNNNLYSLPPYIVEFTALKVFKVDQNPIVWPPLEVLGKLALPESASTGRSRERGRSKDDDLRPQIAKVKEWMRERAEEGEALLTRSRSDLLSQGADEQQAFYLPHSHFSRNDSSISLASSGPMSAGPSAAPRPFEHYRGPSLDSIASPTKRQHSAAPSDDSTRSPPDPSFTSQPSGHSRGASFTASQRLSTNLSAKKSLPDLRQSHAQIIEDRRRGSGENQVPAAEAPKPLGLGIATPAKEEKRRSAEFLRRIALATNVDVGERRGSTDASAVDESRNSYFRRLSTLPVSTISKAIPPALLRFVDAIRGILFALSQVHAALRQFLLFAVDDRVASVFSRVMDPASEYMNTLINALDRFDSTSRRGTPPAQAIRSLLDAAKESVAIFGKVISVLQLQIAVLKTADEARYARTLLLMVYGSMAEIASSWQTMAPLVAELQPLLVNDSHALATRLLSNGGHKMSKTANNSLSSRTPISPIPERGESHSPPSAPRPTLVNQSSPLSGPAAGSPAATTSRPRVKRLAGSFSSLDIEKGMMLSSPSRAGHMASLSDASDALEEETTPTPAPLPPPPPLSARNGFHHHSSSSGSSHAALAPPRKLSVDVRPPTPASATVFDDHLLDVVEHASEIAFTVWLRLAEDLRSTLEKSQGGQESDISPKTMPPPQYKSQKVLELLELTSAAEATTSRLRESCQRLRANAQAETTFAEDAQYFIKAVIRVSELVKAVSAQHLFPQPVRSSLSKLTQATRECAILMQVSSLRPGSASSGLFPLPSARGDEPPTPSVPRNLVLPAKQAAQNRGKGHMGPGMAFTLGQQRQPSSAQAF